MEPCLTLRSDARICAARQPWVTHVVLVRGRPQRVAFRAEAFKIENAERWLIFNIRIGTHQQLGHKVEEQGIRADDLQDLHGVIALDTCQVAMDFEMCVAYIGDDPNGEVFECEVIGTMER